MAISAMPLEKISKIVFLTIELFPVKFDWKIACLSLGPYRLHVVRSGHPRQSWKAQKRVNSIMLFMSYLILSIHA
jgi:hypothetical protein